MTICSLLLQVDINEKIKNAPEGSGYQIGIFVGSMLPFVAIVIIAYLVYKYNKNKIKKE